MGIFQDITLAWKDEEFTIPASRVLGAIAIVEEQITFGELAEASASGKPPMATIAKAFGGVLRYAGSKVTDDEAYAGMFDTAEAQKIATSVNLLLAMMIPPGAMDRIAKVSGEASASGNARAAKAASKRSKRSSKRQLAAVG